MRSVVYFMQPTGGGAIKIGTSNTYQLRMNSFKGWLPQGVQLLATIPGDVYREEALKAALSAHRLQGEWYAAGPVLWRVVLEALDAGDLDWLPLGPEADENGAAIAAEAERLFGSREAAMSAVGVKLAAWRMHIRNYPKQACAGPWGVVVVERLRQLGFLPAYLADVETQDAAA